MLVLSRRENEKLIFEEGGKIITVTVVELRGDKVRIGVEAENSVGVWREEVFKLRREQATGEAT